MINDALVFLKNCLNSYLSAGRDPEQAIQEEPVVFLDGQNMDPLAFKLGAVSILLINLEEENALRPPDLYQRSSPNGVRQKVQPEIRLNLHVLLVARFKQYEESLRYLSLIIQYFQNHRLLDHHNAPELSDNIEQLAIELITLPFSEQNEVWSALRVTYHPSVLYKVKMVIFRDEAAVEMPEVAERILRTNP
jgi:hypothetical protein